MVQQASHRQPPPTEPTIACKTRAHRAEPRPRTSDAVRPEGARRVHAGRIATRPAHGDLPRVPLFSTLNPDAHFDESDAIGRKRLAQAVDNVPRIERFTAMCRLFG